MGNAWSCDIDTCRSASGFKTITATAIDTAENITSVSIDVNIDNPSTSSIASAKMGTLPFVSLEDAVVTAGTDVFGNAFYMQSFDAPIGICVEPTASEILAGDLVRVVGDIQTVDGELKIGQADVNVISHNNPIPKPYAISNINLCGGAMGLQQATYDYRRRPIPDTDPPQYERSLGESIGLNNIGLLVRTWGVVTYIGDGFFYIHDGSELDDGNNLGSYFDSIKGIRVAQQCSGMVGDFVIVTGISSCTTHTNEGYITRLLRPTRPEDTLILGR